MSLKAGNRIGHYEILTPLGAGGMGEVYRARDHRLDRDVALKVLPDDVASNPVRRARFEREAKALAAADHPAIVTVHSIEEIDGRYVLTMQLVEGRTLEEAIPRGGFELDAVLKTAIPLADGLAHAHRKGVVHRDLKPGNIMLSSEGKIRILDFGLARLEAQDVVEASLAPTLTRAGATVGTPAYMSPEQIKGQPVDERSDIFALGLVLYQMATGSHPFSGSTPTELASAILRDEAPHPSERKASLPRQFDRIVGRCLNKDPDRRFQTTADVANELRDLETETELTVLDRRIVSDSTASRWTRIAAAGLLVGVVAVALWVFAQRTGSNDIPDTPRSARTAPRLSQLAVAAGLEEWAAWSPDGTQVAYTAEVDGFKSLHVRDLESGESRRLTAADRDELQPVWGPGGTSLYFVRADKAGGKLTPGDVLSWFARDGDVWKLDLATGDETLIVEGGFNPAIDPEGDRLAFDSIRGGPRRIWTTDLRGRNPRQVSTDASEFVAHVDPSWSPDGTRIVYRRAGGVQSDIHALDLASAHSAAITDDGFLDMDPVWSPDGRWIYFSSYRGGGLNLWRIATSSEGAATSVPQQITTGAGHDLQAAISPDSSTLVFTVLQQNTDLWRLPVDPKSAIPTGDAAILVATTREDSRGNWSPDGSQVAFNSDRRGNMNLWLWQESGEQQMTHGPGGDYQPSWAPDGSRLVFFSSRSGNADIWTVDLDDGELTQLTTSAGLDMNPSYSPDGAWIAFQSDRDGRLEPWIMRADGSDQRRLADVPATVHYLVWWPDGRSVFFRSRHGAERPIYRVAIEDGAIDELPQVSSGAHMSLSPDASLILDVDVHKNLIVFPVDGSAPRSVFSFEDAASRIDYPRWSPNGEWILFDRADPQGADLWLLEGF